jgi:hypothetical protein
LLAAGGVAALGALNQPVEASSQACLKLRDFEGLKKINDTTYLASTRLDHGKFIVTLQGACRALEQPANPYTLRVYSNRECFDRDDALVFRNGQVCFIQSVVPAPAN